MKKVLALVLAAAMTLSLAACGGGNNVTSHSGNQQSTVGDKTDSPVVNTLPVEGDGSSDEDFGGNAADEDQGFTQPDVDLNEPSDDVTDKGPRPLTKDTSAGEKYISDQFFGKSDLTTDDIRERIGEQVAETVGDTVIADLQLIVNMYSIEGVYRDLEYANEEYEHVRQAMVVACWMIGVEYEALFANGYMTRDEAQPLLDMLTSVSQG